MFRVRENGSSCLFNVFRDFLGDSINKERLTTNPLQNMKARSQIPELTLKDRTTFLKKTRFGEGCWEWQSADDGRGYGVMYVDKTPYKAHRISFQIFYGHISTELQIDHLCMNKRCVNPKHLEQVTQKENLRRGNALSSVYSRRTHCKRGHKLGGDNVTPSAMKRGVRSCRACGIETTKLSKERRLNKSI